MDNWYIQKSGFNKDEIIKVIEESLDLSKEKEWFEFPKILKKCSTN